MTEAPVGFTVRPAALWGTVGALVLVLAGIPWVRGELLTATVRAPEPFTAIAFTDPTAPLDCRRGTASIAITNHDGAAGAARTYAVTVTAVGTGYRHTARSAVTVPSGGTGTAVVRFGATAPTGTRVAVSLGTEAGTPSTASPHLQATCPTGPA